MTPAPASWSEHTTGGCDVRVLPGGHFYLQDRQEEVAALTLDWVGTLRPTRSP
ncbi:hypothetical protein ACFYRY_18335 [Streptomyces sp. NPDC005263]|uniref:hypothetical protein n=1 Tax=Streptomyces sp. NPDC005263 TaxID=3364711 RepID=UPI00368742A6